MSTFVSLFVCLFLFVVAAGAAQFLQLVRSLEKEDEEVGRLSDQLRAHFLPPMTAPIHSIPTSTPQCNGAPQQ